MGIISKTIFIVAGNASGLYVATKYIPGFNVPLDMTNLLITALVLSAINVFIRPIIKLVLSPLILITLGIASILVNLATLKLLDYLLLSVTITDIGSLVLATIVIGTVNFLIHILY
ncbi:MAG: phage holin family protein [Patescibacteria group bacterium]